ncbi:hypothetical protein GCM10028822_30240 [Hymenobacter terrigena]
MHLSKAGFEQLIRGGDIRMIKPFDSKTWRQTWDEFIFLARRWDDQQLINVFGKNIKTGGPKHHVTDPFEHWDDLKESDYRLVGEFIRRNHARFAHEVALFGIPGYKGTAFQINNKLPKEHRDIAGLIARSHNLNIRDCVSYLHKYDRTGRNYQNIHAVYLMALLRVADIMQIHASRASGMVLKCREVVSPLSRNEFLSHQAVTNISFNSDDKEALWVEAMPQKVAVFLRLKEWLSWIQNELDSSWAVLGEVYGSQEDLRHLGLRYRRVRSNLDDVAEFAKSEGINYIPARIRFDVARAELLKLLIGPLYGDDPSYGVRELMQNSVDAVREYEHYVQNNPQYANIARRSQEADVVIELSALDDCGRSIMTISDRGIGMSEYVIREYFLRAGASYRQSSAWKTSFETDDISENNAAKSKVLRSGRFGVGALAAFLIGHRIEVETRHINNDFGYHFITSLDSEIIEITRSDKFAIGTSIKIHVESEEHNKLLDNRYKHLRPSQWDWYCMDSPSVSRFHYSSTNEKIVHESIYKIDLFDNKKWRELKSMDFGYRIFWTDNDAPALSCNGIFVNDMPVTKLTAEKTMKLRQYSEGTGAVSEENDYPEDNDYIEYNLLQEVNPNLVLYPLISILDPDGLFPLNLARTGIRAEDYSFGEEIRKDILTEMLAWFFFNGLTSITDKSIEEISFKKWLNYQGRGSLIVASNSGYGLMCNALLNNKSVSVVLTGINGRADVGIKGKNVLVFANRYSEGIRSDIFTFDVERNKTRVLSGEWKSRSLLFDNKGPNQGESTIYAKESESGTTYRALAVEKVKSKLNFTKFEVKNDPFLSYDISFEIRDSDINLNLSNHLLEERIYPEGSYVKSKTMKWALDDVWLKLFGNNWIPYSMEDRLSAFPDAVKLFKSRYPQSVPEKYL